MSDTPAQEPTMEEILASIRRIISEDDAPAAKEEALPIPEPLEEPAPAPVMAMPEPEPEDDVLELTERVDPPAVETLGDLEVYTASAVEPEPEPAPLPVFEPEPEPVFQAPEPAPVLAPIPMAEGLVGAATASVAASHFGKLTSSLLMPANGRTLEDVVRELLTPLLKDWLEENLPGIVEAKVEEEVSRIARGGGRVG